MHSVYSDKSLSETTVPAESWAQVAAKVGTIEELADQDRLGSIAADKREPLPVRIEAISRLDDQQVLTRIAKDPRDCCRSVALERIEDKELLFQLAVADDDEEIATSAALLLAEENLYKKIVESETARLETRQAVLKKITDQDFLLKVALLSGFEPLELAAIENLTDDMALLHILESRVSLAAKQAAVYKVTDIERLILVKNRLQDGALKMSVVVRIKQLKAQRDQVKSALKG